MTKQWYSLLAYGLTFFLFTFNVVRCSVNTSLIAINKNSTETSICTLLKYVISEVFIVRPPVKNSCNYMSKHDNNGNETSVEQLLLMNLPQENFIQSYSSGIRSYLANDWAHCVNELETALYGYHDYYAAITSCRIECAEIIDVQWQQQGNEQISHLMPGNVANLHFYESIVRQTLCLEKCKRILLTNLPLHFIFDGYANDAFMQRKIYDYLQLCYYRTGELVKAASATFTAILKNPTKMMLRNLEFYVTNITNFTNTTLIDYEEKAFVQYFLKALLAYARSNWIDVIDLMEQSLKQYLRDHSECRAFCEGVFDQGWHTDFISSTANHFTYTLRCKRNCTRDLEMVRGKHYDQILAIHYEYLQMAYFKVNKIQDAYRATITYLLLNPSSIEMQANLRYYQQLDQQNYNTLLDKQIATPRIEAKRYHKIEQYEMKLLTFIDKEFAIIASN